MHLAAATIFHVFMSFFDDVVDFHRLSVLVHMYTRTETHTYTIYIFFNDSVRLFHCIDGLYIAQIHGAI